jgi:alpha-beta hydrolase superfamily lysophospholipase
MRRGQATLLGAAVGATLAAVPVALAYLFLHPPRRFHRKTPKSALGLDYERIRLTTTDNHTLSGWWVPHPQPRGVVTLCHGYYGNRETMLPYLEFLHRGGFAALLFDFRRHGWSEGRRTSFGHEETRDLDAALEWLHHSEKLGHLPLVVLGESMGAAVALQVAAREPRIAAVVADSSYARLDSAVRGRLALAFGPALAAVVTPPTQWMGERMLGIPTRSIAPIEVAPALDGLPTLLIHGDADGLIAVENAFELYRACGADTELWITRGVRHVRSVHEEKEYADRVLAFLDRNLK